MPTLPCPATASRMEATVTALGTRFLSLQPACLRAAAACVAWSPPARRTPENGGMWCQTRQVCAEGALEQQWQPVAGQARPTIAALPLADRLADMHNSTGTWACHTACPTCLDELEDLPARCLVVGADELCQRLQEPMRPATVGACCVLVAALLVAQTTGNHIDVRTSLPAAVAGNRQLPLRSNPSHRRFLLWATLRRKRSTSCSERPG